MCPAISLHRVLSKDTWKLEDIKKILERDSSSVNEKNFESYTPLICVLLHENCSADVVKLLLRYGADVNCADKWFLAPLYVALTRRREDAVVMALIENGADLRVFKFCFQSPLCVALSSNASADVIRMLLDKGCPLNACMFHDHSVLHCATDNKRSILNSAVFHILMGRGADINAVNSNGRSVVCFALQGGYDAHDIKFLLEAGGSLNGCPIHASTLICATNLVKDYLRFRKSPLKASLVQLLLKAGACADTVDAEGLTPLQCALRNGPYEKGAITLLLDCHKGVDLNSVVDKGNNSLLYLAVGNSNCIPSAVKLLIKGGVKVDKLKKGGTTELFEAVSNVDPKWLPSIIKTLLKNDAKVNDKIVSLSVIRRLPEVLQTLLASGVSMSESAFYSLLETASRLCSGIPARLVCLKLLAKYDFLKTCSFEYYLNCYHKKFRNQCASEVYKIKSRVSYPLYKFLVGSSSPYRDASDLQTEEKMRDFDRLLDIIAMDPFPIYFDVITERIGRPLMVTKLQEISVYAMKYYPHNAHAPEEITLHYYDVVEIARYLSNEDLLRFILEFYNADGRVSSTQDIKGKKRTAEEPYLRCKLPRLCKK